MHSASAFIILVSCVSLAVVLGDGQNADGSFSIGNEYQGQGSTGDSLYALLTKASGWTQNTLNHDRDIVLAPQESVSIANEVPNLIGSTVHVVRNVPYLEILRLLESFLKLKGEIASRLYVLRNDNIHVINAIINTLVVNIPTLHRFTLSAVVALRNIFEYASRVVNDANLNVAAGATYAP